MNVTDSMFAGGAARLIVPKMPLLPAVVGPGRRTGRPGPSVPGDAVARRTDHDVAEAVVVEVARRGDRESGIRARGESIEDRAVDRR